MRKISKRKKFFYIFEKVVTKLASLVCYAFQFILINAIDIPYQLFYKPFKRYVINLTAPKFKKDLIEFVGGTLAFTLFCTFILLLGRIE